MTNQGDKKQPGVIRRLDECVVNRIAAGEVIQRPANALKELMENSLDSGATSIQISVKSGGLKLLQIQDNGCGIRKEDLPIVCKRFTTSKLQKFEDLEEIETYGFRGEALASISHVAHVAIVSKTEDSQCAFRAEYSDGKLKETAGVPNPKACAGNQGTIIIVEDLFYNMETRRRALKNPSDEYNKIVDVATRYAVHNSKVGFRVKKVDVDNVDVRTPVGSNVIDNIRILYGGQIARELLEIKCTDNPHYKLAGYVSNANFPTKKSNFLLFINHRLVESTAIRKAVDAVYATYLPKGAHPFIYLSIEISPKNVDVNVHPTKHEVHFLHEDLVVANIASTIESLLLGSNQSRTFFVQSLLPGATAIETNTGANVAKRRQKLAVENEPGGKSKSSDTTYQKDMIRTDKNMQKLDKFFTSTPKSDAENSTGFAITSSQHSNISAISMAIGNENRLDTSMDSNSSGSTTSSGRRRDMRLASVKMLLTKIETDCHNGLLSLFRNHIFVGCVDRGRALIQHETKLYMVNTAKLSYEFFYQKVVNDFGNFGRIAIEDPTTIQDLVLTELNAKENGQDAIDDAPPTNNKDAAEKIQEFLLQKSKMLDDYFALKFDSDGRIRSIPMLLENYCPSVTYLSSYLIDLAQKVVWSKERECFETFAQVTASFYAVKPGDDEANDEEVMNGRSWKWIIEHILFPEVRASLLPPKIFAEDSTIVQLADLPDLYKVFERC